MNMFEKAFKKTDKGQFTERIFGMENRQFYNPEKLDYLKAFYLTMSINE